MNRVTDFLWRGPRPKDLNELVQLGFENIICLESGWYELLSSSKRERQFPCELGLNYYDMGLSDITPPSQFDAGFIIQKINQLKGKTYIHCLTGVDRTGFICAVYRMKFQDWTFEQAHKEFVDMGRHWWFAWWKYELKKWGK